MIAVIADNITSPLGMTTTDNMAQIRAGQSALCRYKNRWGLHEAFVASLFSDAQKEQIMRKGYTFFESIVLYSIREAFSHMQYDIQSDRTGLILSTTKANIELIELTGDTEFLPSTAARHIVDDLGLKIDPIVVCNACISGVEALILANRLLKMGEFDNIIVCGCDVQGKFIVSGFQSLKALAPMACRPFDIERMGMNPGEAAATIILSNKYTNNMWMIERGVVRNDAFHITNPSPHGIGCKDAIIATLANTHIKDLAMINVHGTGTLYNDQMESKAIEAAGLSSVPINSLKGYYGHTMGAAGVLETIVSMHALDDQTILATKGFSQIGVSGKVSISNTDQHSQNQCFLKVISGFGGCNAAIKLSRIANEDYSYSFPMSYQRKNHVKITPKKIYINGNELETDGSGKNMLKNFYKKYIGDYPKFYKMDILSQLGFIASELLLQNEEEERFLDRNDRAIVLFNNSSSCCADKEFQHSIASNENFYPSPSVFVYTLPNIVVGEIAIRNKYHAETSFYILQNRNEEMMGTILRSTFEDKEIYSIITGWINAYDSDNFETELTIIHK